MVDGQLTLMAACSRSSKWHVERRCEGGVQDSFGRPLLTELPPALLPKLPPARVRARKRCEHARDASSAARATLRWRAAVNPCLLFTTPSSSSPPSSSFQPPPLAIPPSSYSSLQTLVGATLLPHQSLSNTAHRRQHKRPDGHPHDRRSAQTAYFSSFSGCPECAAWAAALAHTDARGQRVRERRASLAAEPIRAAGHWC